MPSGLLKTKNRPISHKLAIGLVVLNFFQDFADVLRFHSAVDLLAYHHHWSESAGSDAAQAVKGEFPVRGSLSHIYADNSFDFFEDFF